MLKHYVEYLHFDGSDYRASVEEIYERNLNNVRLYDNCAGFRFFDRKVIVLANGEMFTSNQEINISGWYYFGGVKMTLEEVKATFGNDSEYSGLISKMEKNKAKAIVRLKFGGNCFWCENDKII